MKYKKLLLSIGLAALVIVLSSCQNSAPPAAPIFTVNGLWTMTTVVTKSDVSGYDIGDTEVGITLIEISGNKITFRNPSGTSKGYTGTRTKNHINIKSEDKESIFSIQGDFLSNKSFSGTMTFISKIFNKTVLFDVSMAKR